MTQHAQNMEMLQDSINREHCFLLKDCMGELGNLKFRFTSAVLRCHKSPLSVDFIKHES